MTLWRRGAVLPPVLPLVLPLLVVLSAWGLVAAEVIEVPYLTSRVMDEANLLPEAAETELEARLGRFEAETGHQLAVLTVPNLGGEPIEDYSMRVVETWKLGRAEEDDGVLLLVARDDRQMRLEVGYGLEGRLTDMGSRRILDHVVAPRFRDGDFAGGVSAGADAVMAVLQDEGAETPVDPLAGRYPEPFGIGDLAGLLFGGLLMLILLVTILSVLSVGALRGLGSGWGSGWGRGPRSSSGSWGSSSWGSNSWGSSSWSGSSRSRSSWGGSSRSRSSGRSSFRGGGGSFGGGGASSSW